MIDYLKPKCTASTIDGYTNVTLLLNSVKRVVDRFSGTLLDIGCGHMPYRSLILEQSTKVTGYKGMDLYETGSPYDPPDVIWDGSTIPLPDNSVDSALMTEVLEHCPNALRVLQESFRVLKPGGFLFVTVPFIWPMHDVPYDEFRYTAYSLRRFYQQVGFENIVIEGTGGRHAVLATTLGLWARRRPLTSRVHVVTKKLFSILLVPIIRLLTSLDERPTELGESTLVVGLCVTANKPK